MEHQNGNTQDDQRPYVSKILIEELDARAMRDVQNDGSLRDAGSKTL